METARWITTIPMKLRRIAKKVEKMGLNVSSSSRWVTRKDARPPNRPPTAAAVKSDADTGAKISFFSAAIPMVGRNTRFHTVSESATKAPRSPPGKCVVRCLPRPRAASDASASFQEATRDKLLPFSYKDSMSAQFKKRPSKHTAARREDCLREQEHDRQ